MRSAGCSCQRLAEEWVDRSRTKVGGVVETVLSDTGSLQREKWKREGALG